MKLKKTNYVEHALSIEVISKNKNDKNIEALLKEIEFFSIEATQLIKQIKNTKPDPTTKKIDGLLRKNVYRLFYLDRKCKKLIKDIFNHALNIEYKDEKDKIILETIIAYDQKSVEPQLSLVTHDKLKRLSFKLIKQQHNFLPEETIRETKSEIERILNSNIQKSIAIEVIKLEKTHKKSKIINDPKSIVNIKNVYKYYENNKVSVNVLKNVDLQFSKGEFVVILGPSGSGKTSLLNLLSGMDKASFGDVFVCNKNLTLMNDAELTKFRKDKIGYIFQQYGLMPNLTVLENIQLGAELQDDEKKRLDVFTLMKNMKIIDHKNKFPHQLSGGQQQRVSIARSMAKNPEIIFGDEPTAAVDEEMAKEILKTFVDINLKYKTTIILVTHDHEIAKLASIIIKVNSGKISSVIKNKRIKNVNKLDWNL